MQDKIQNTCRGQYSVKIEHVVDAKERMRKNYPYGVGLNFSPLFDLVDDPWNHLERLHRKMLVAHQVISFFSMKSKQTNIRLIDFASSYGEMATLFSRLRKPQGSTLDYVGLDIDEDKVALARELNPSSNFVICDLRSLDLESLEPKADALISSDIPEEWIFDKGIGHLLRLSELLKPGGIFCFGFCTPWNTDRKNTDGWYIKTVKERILSSGKFSFLDGFYQNVPLAELSDDIDKRKLKRFPHAISRSFISGYFNKAGTNAIISFKKEN